MCQLCSVITRKKHPGRKTGGCSPCKCENSYRWWNMNLSLPKASVGHSSGPDLKCWLRLNPVVDYLSSLHSKIGKAIRQMTLGSRQEVAVLWSCLDIVLKSILCGNEFLSCDYFKSLILWLSVLCLMGWRAVLRGSVDDFVIFGMFIRLLWLFLCTVPILNFSSLCNFVFILFKVCYH